MSNDPERSAYGAAFTITRPVGAPAPVIFASPHSGSLYPGAMQANLRVPLIDLRRTEDAYIEELYGDVPRHGGTLIYARYSRMVVDLNRDPRELDPAMFSDGVPRPCGVPTTRVDAGLGCLPRVAARGEAIYARPITRAEGEGRLAAIHDTWHSGLSAELNASSDRFGECVLIDCHSMPSRQPGRRNLADIVLGDRFGSSCSHRLTGLVERAFRARGLTVARNAPYAGGYTTRRYGRPKRGVHALQIEVNRGLYMDETRIERSSDFARMRILISEVSAEITDFSRQIG